MAGEMNGNLGDQKTPEGDINSIMGGTLAGTSQGNPNSAAQKDGSIVQADSFVPPADLFSGNANANINNYFDQLKTATSYNQLGLTPDGKDINVAVTSYTTPNLNDDALAVIRQGIPQGKAAKSGAGLPENLGFSPKDIGDTINVINTYLPKYIQDNKLQPKDVQAITGPIVQYQTAYQNAVKSGDANAKAEALAQLKFAVGVGSKVIGDHLYSQDQAGLLSDDAQKDMSHLYSINTKAQEFKSYRDKDGASLQKYLQDASTPVTRMYDAPASTLPSKEAKSKMIANPWYTQLVQQYSGTPAYEMLVNDMNQPTITSVEKKFLSAIQPQIEGVKEQYNAIYQKYGYNTAQTMFKDMLPMFDLMYYQSETMLDDIINTMGTGIQNQTQSLYGSFISPVIQ